MVSVFQFFFSLYAFLVFVALLVLLFPFFLLAALGGKIKGGNAIMRLCRFWGDCWLLLIGIRHQVSEENRPDPKKSYIFVGNHISYIDAAFIITSVRQPFRALGAAEYGRYPLFGYVYQLVVVCVHRKDPDSRAASVQVLRTFLRKGISVLIYPEGTFNMGTTALSEFYNGAFRLAIETQTPIKPLLFLDAFDRMHYRSLFTVNPGRSRAVFLEEVSVEGYTLDDLETLKQRVYQLMESQLLQRKVP
ncbi:MAG: 1-acyl-sn-glycerol-3-phosphate acyltransferase [Bacteroidetes bacterium]|nr:1-acyl-sn-glycerol-3-phosphate acyltransferase [Bacteroidota bacterium]